MQRGRFILAFVALMLLAGSMTPAQAAADDVPPPPSQTVKLVFIHHSCGGELAG